MATEVKKSNKKIVFWIVRIVVALFIIGKLAEESNEDMLIRKEKEMYQDSIESAQKAESQRLTDSIVLASQEQERLENEMFEYKSDWNLAAFGNVVEIVFNLKNNSKDLIFKKPVFEIQYLNSLKEIIDVKTKEIPVELMPGKSYKSESINLGFKPDFMEYTRTILVSVEKIKK